MVVKKNDFLHRIIEVEKQENGNKYRVEVEVPMNAWYDDMMFVVEGGQQVKLKHKENKDGKVYFEGDIELPTSAVCRYYFTCFADGYPRIFKKEVKINNMISYHDYKMIVSLEVV